VSNLLNDKGVTYEDINALENDELREKYEIQSVPVLILLDENDNVVDKVNGYDPEGIERLVSQI
jgi:thioredoxin 1